MMILVFLCPHCNKRNAVKSWWKGAVPDDEVSCNHCSQTFELSTAKQVERDE